MLDEFLLGKRRSKTLDAAAKGESRPAGPPSDWCAVRAEIAEGQERTETGRKRRKGGGRGHTERSPQAQQQENMVRVRLSALFLSLPCAAGEGDEAVEGVAALDATEAAEAHETGEKDEMAQVCVAEVSPWVSTYLLVQSK